MSDRALPDLDAALIRLFADDAESQPPKIAELVAFVNGELESDAADELAVRLADHSEAMDLVLQLRRFARAGKPDPEAVADGVAEDELAEEIAGWLADDSDEIQPAELQPRVDSVMAEIGHGRAEPSQSAQPATAVFAAPNSRHVLPWQVMSWAAALLLALGLAATWLVFERQENLLRRQLTEAQSVISTLAARPTPSVEPSGSPMPGMALVDLFADQRLRGPGVEASGEAERVELETGAPLTVILTPRQPLPGHAYELILYAPKGAEEWRGPATADPSGAVVVLLPAGLTRGSWRFELATEVSQDRFDLQVGPAP